MIKPIKFLILIVFTFLTICSSLFINLNKATASSDLFFGEHHYYTVIFRGNGEAIIYAKLVFTNTQDSLLTNYSFNIPGVNVYDMSIYQQVLSPQCIQYDYKSTDRTCLKYQDPDYNNNYGYTSINGSTSDYQKVHFNQEDSAYNLSLITPVQPNKSSAIILAYATKGYVQNSLGLFTFNFETPKVQSRISDLKVAVDVDSDLLLKGKQSQVNYQSTSLANISIPANSGVANSSLDSIVRYVGGSAPMMKEAKDLAPDESFTVRGEYSTSWFRLYLNSIMISIGIITLVFFLGFFLIKFLNNRSKHKQQNIVESIPASTSSVKQTVFGPHNHFGIFDLIFAFISVLLTIGLTVSISQLSRQGFSYMGYYPYQSNPTFQVVMLITILFMYLFTLLGPAVVLSLVKGWRSMIYVLLSEFLWLIALLIVYFLLFQMGSNSPYTYPAYPIGPRPL